SLPGLPTRGRPGASDAAWNAAQYFGVGAHSEPGPGLLHPGRTRCACTAWARMGRVLVDDGRADPDFLGAVRKERDRKPCVALLAPVSRESRPLAVCAHCDTHGPTQDAEQLIRRWRALGRH